MKPCLLPGLVAISATLLITGCSDPASDVHQSAASDPKAAPGTTSAAAKTFIIQPDSKIDFVGSKVTGKHDGGFTNITGTIQVADGKITGSPEIKIDLNSIWSDNGRLTRHLKSADFFDVEKFPQSTFTATSIGTSNSQELVTGNLDLHGVTKSISFPADIDVGDDSVTVKAEFAINRRDFNINYPGQPNDLIRDNVVLKLDIKAAPNTQMASE